MIVREKYAVITINIIKNCGLNLIPYRLDLFGNICSGYTMAFLFDLIFDFSVKFFTTDNVENFKVITER